MYMYFYTRYTCIHVCIYNIVIHYNLLCLCIYIIIIYIYVFIYSFIYLFIYLFILYVHCILPGYRCCSIFWLKTQEVATAGTIGCRIGGASTNSICGLWKSPMQLSLCCIIIWKKVLQFPRNQFWSRETVG